MIFKKVLKNKKAISALLAGMAFIFFSCQSRPIIIKEAPSESPTRNKYSTAISDYEEGRYEKAVVSLRALLQDSPDHPETGMIKYYLVSSLFYTGKYEEAVAHSTELIREYPDSPERYRVQKVLGASSREMGKLYEACFWMLKAQESAAYFRASKSELDDISKAIKEIIYESKAEDLNRMTRLTNIEPYSPDIYYRLSSIYLENGNFYRARSYATLLLETTDDKDWESKGRLLLADINRDIEIRGDVKRNAIGCLLPLKGPNSFYGKELLKGIQLGMEIFRSMDEAEPVELIIKNTNGTEENTLSAIDDLVKNEKVIAIIGPLGSVSSAAAGKKAQATGVPIITFTETEGIAEEGDMVFRNFLTPSKEVEIILKKAVHDMEMTRFGIFYPDTPYGRFFMNLFWDRVEGMGCEISAVESYPPGDTDFTEGIKKMVGLHYPRPESIVKMLEEEKRKEEIAELEELGLEEIFIMPADAVLMKIADPECPVDFAFDEIVMAEYINVPDGDEEPAEEEAAVEEPEEEEEEPEPIDDFDAVFIPDNSENIALIAPQFPFNSIFNVPYLGTSKWLSDELIETTADYIQGAVFPTGFYINQDSEEVREFVRLYNESFGEDPGVLAATGFDTIRLIKHILSNVEIFTRYDFQKALMENDDYTGITGKISFDEYGEVEKDPVLLTVYGRRLHTIQLNPPPHEQPEPSLEDDIPQEDLSTINGPDMDSPATDLQSEGFLD
ncbi:ABC transporter substrate-binding protein [Thermodesulfobacteriota bacterium]